jgi:glycosyltransferase involved in cell wall biosynthesis
VKRRILLLITDLEIGGTPTVVRQLATSLNSDPDFEVQVACLDRAGPLAAQIESAGICVTPLDARGSWDVGVLARFIALGRRERFHTIFSFLVHANAVAAMARPFLPGVGFLQSIQTAQPEPRWHWAVQHISARLADQIIVPSASVAAAAVERAQIPDEKIVITPNAVEVSRFAAMNSQRQGTRVGFLGRLDPVKRVNDLVQALALIPPPATLEIFGAGHARKGIEQTVDRLNLRQRVTLHGSVADPVEALSKMDILVLPSDAEGFGLVLIEAMAAGVPVIGTNVAGIRDVVRHNENGLLVPPRSPAALASAIRALLTDSSLRERLAGGGTRSVHKNFNWKRIYPRYRAILLGLPVPRM